MPIRTWWDLANELPRWKGAEKCIPMPALIHCADWAVNIVIGCNFCVAVTRRMHLLPNLRFAHTFGSATAFCPVRPRKIGLGGEEIIG